jgi:arylsulfatase
MREPGIFWWPGRVAAATTTSVPASILDLLPTMAELAGADIPSDRVIDGRSIADLLLGETEGLPQEPFFYYFGAQLQAIRLGNWKLFLSDTQPHEQSASLWYLHNPELYERHHRQREEAELYDLADDRGETRNLARERPEIVERLDGIARRFDERMQREKRHPVYLDGR